MAKSWHAGSEGGSEFKIEKTANRVEWTDVAVYKQKNKSMTEEAATSSATKE